MRDQWRLVCLLQDSSISPYFACFGYLIPSYKTTSLPSLELQTLPLEPLISCLNPQFHCHICEGISCVTLTTAVTKGHRTLPLPKEVSEAVPGTLGSWRPARGRNPQAWRSYASAREFPALEKTRAGSRKGGLGFDNQFVKNTDWTLVETLVSV